MTPTTAGIVECGGYGRRDQTGQGGHCATERDLHRKRESDLPFGQLGRLHQRGTESRIGEQVSQTEDNGRDAKLSKRFRAEQTRENNPHDKGGCASAEESGVVPPIAPRAEDVNVSCI